MDAASSDPRDQLQADRDTRPEAMAKLAGADYDLASSTLDIGGISDALRSYIESRTILERLARDNPAVTNYLLIWPQSATTSASCSTTRAIRPRHWTRTGGRWRSAKGWPATTPRSPSLSAI
jgi:hypothetical protein